MYTIGWCVLQYPLTRPLKLLPPVILVVDNHHIPMLFLLFWWLGDLSLMFSGGLDIPMIVGLIFFGVGHGIYQQKLLPDSGCLVVASGLVIIASVLVIWTKTEAIVAQVGLPAVALIFGYFGLVLNGVILSALSRNGSRWRGLGYGLFLLSDLLILITVVIPTLYGPLTASLIINLYWIGLYLLVYTSPRWEPI